MTENCCSTSAGVLNGPSELLAPLKAENNRTSAIDALLGGVASEFGDPSLSGLTLLLPSFAAIF